MIEKFQDRENIFKANSRQWSNRSRVVPGEGGDKYEHELVIEKDGTNDLN